MEKKIYKVDVDKVREGLVVWEDKKYYYTTNPIGYGTCERIPKKEIGSSDYSWFFDKNKAIEVSIASDRKYISDAEDRIDKLSKLKQ